MSSTEHEKVRMPVVGRRRCAHCTSRYGIDEFVERVRNDRQFAAALNEAMAVGATRRVGEFLCEHSYSASAQEFAVAMESELDNPQLTHLAKILALWGHGRAAAVGGP
jgi:hypothetical protein